ncbi:hypothetical protein UT300019_27890 [Clostridium sp. CTA-19]
MNKGKVKKKIYKRWWFWTVAIIFILILANPLNNNSKTIKEKNSVESDKKKSEEKVVEDKTKTRDNSTAVETVLATGNFIVGQDIPKGRYVCTSDSSGNFIIYDKDNIPVVNEILGDENFGVTKVTVDIKDGEKIDIGGIKNVKFTPANTELLQELTTGIWEVGLDIKEGRYVASSAKGQGNFIVYRKGLPITNEILSDSGEFGVPSITLEIKNGDLIQISALEKVIFNSK